MTDNGHERSLTLEATAALNPDSVKTAVEHMDSPRFDFSDLSWDESMALGVIKPRIDAVVKQFENDELTMTRELFKIMAEVKALMAKCITYVPRVWLVRSAPDLIDWSLPDSFGRYLRPRTAGELLGLMSEAMNSGEGEKKGST